MRLMRALLACLLSLAVVVQGHAASGALDASCLSHHHGSPADGHSSAGDDVVADTHAQDLRAGHGTAGQAHGSHSRSDAATDDPAPCSCVAGCHAVTSLPVGLTLQVQTAQFSSPVPAWTARHFRSLSPPAHWRPPAAI